MSFIHWSFCCLRPGVRGPHRGLLRLVGDPVKGDQQRVPAEDHGVQVDQQLQEGLSLGRNARVEAESRLRPSDPIGQQRHAELPELQRPEVLQELLQRRQRLGGHGGSRG